MASQLSNSPNVQDEAQEKLFSEHNDSFEPKIEIKFLDAKNGDTKIDISGVRQVFVGMGKDELMKFANDPFWVRTRWFLFILFWVLWVGMLSGAVAIILLAPKCVSTDHSQKLGSVLYQVNIENFKDSNGDGKGDIAGLESKLDYFKSIGIDTLLLKPLMKTAPGSDDVIDFKALNPDYGTISDFKNLIATAKNKGLKLLMTIIPNFSSIKHKWFEHSVAREDPFTNYYVWTDPNYVEDSNKPINNWVSVFGGSAWEWNAERKQYYLHQFNVSQPDFNFTNPNIVNYFKNVFSFWLDLGLTGLHLDKIEYLIEDKSFLDEKPAMTKTGFIHTDYKFFSHTRTIYQSETLPVLSGWADIFRNYSAILSLSGIQDGVKFEKGDLIFRPIRVEKSISAEDLKEALNNRLNRTAQTWGILCDSKEGCNVDTLIGLQAVLLMLPGKTVVHSGLELGLPLNNIFQWDSTNNQGFSEAEPWKQLDITYSNRSVATEKSEPSSFYNIFKRIIGHRNEPSIVYGSTNVSVVNTTVLVVTRIKPGYSQYSIAFNLGDEEKVLNIENILQGVPPKLIKVITHSIHVKEDYSHLQNGIKSFAMPGKSFFVFQGIIGSKD